jgi:hypothetical protein
VAQRTEGQEYPGERAGPGVGRHTDSGASFRTFTVLWPSIQPVKNRELKIGYQGIAFPDT